MCRSGGAEDGAGHVETQDPPETRGAGGRDIKGGLKVSTGNAEETQRAGKEC